MPETTPQKSTTRYVSLDNRFGCFNCEELAIIEFALVDHLIESDKLGQSVYSLNEELVSELRSETAKHL